MESLHLEAIEAHEALTRGKRLGKAVAHESFQIELVHHNTDVWVVFRSDEDGGIALRAPLFTASATVTRKRQKDCLIAWEAHSDIGRFTGQLTAEKTGLAQFAYRVRFTPALTVHLPYFPRDLIPFDQAGNPQTTRGSIEAKQRKLNTGLCYLELERPKLGKLLYVQNLTALNPYFLATGTKPESVVGGEWPVLGYLAPTQPDDRSAAIPAGQETVLYDTHLVFRRKAEEDEAESAWQFLDMLGAIYRTLDKPRTVRRPWIERSRHTLRDLARSPKARQSGTA